MERSLQSLGTKISTRVDVYPGIPRNSNCCICGARPELVMGWDMTMGAAAPCRAGGPEMPCTPEPPPPRVSMA